MAGLVTACMNWESDEEKNSLPAGLFNNPHFLFVTGPAK